MENMLLISLQVQKKNLEKSNSYVMNSYENLMETMKWTVNQTLKAMNIPESDVERVRH